MQVATLEQARKDMEHEVYNLAEKTVHSPSSLFVGAKGG